MRIQINDRTNVLGEAAFGRVMDIVEATFSKYLSRVKSVVLTANDLNGPKGGIDKRCRVLVSMNGRSEVAVSAEHESLYQAIRLAVKRAERTVSRKSQKSMRRDRR
jgi:ribosome-associated translation inhibitor RaiA